MLITATEIIQKSWSTYSQNWKKLLPYIILVFSASAILTLVGFGGVWIESVVTNNNLIFSNNLLIATLTVAIMLFILWTTISLTKNLRNLIENKPMINTKESYLQTSKYLWPVIWTSVLVILAIIFGFVLLFIPALIFAIWFTYSFYIVIFEDKKGYATLKESRALVSGRWWKTFWLLLAPTFFFGIIILSIQMVISLPFDIFLDHKSLAYIFSTSAVSTIVSAIFTPLSALTTLYLYLSAKENPITTSLPPTIK